MRHHRPGFVADRDHDALIDLRCPRAACRAVYLVPYDDLVAQQRGGTVSGTDCYAERLPRQRVARLVRKAQRASQAAVRATGVKAGRVPPPR